MTDTLRFGILGTGNIAGQFAHGVAGSKRCVITAVGSRSQSSADGFAGRFNVPTAHGSYDALLADDTVDAVYVSLPNTMHHDWTLRALDAGKHVLCEKPLACSVAEAEAMFHAADQADRLLVEAFMYQSHPITKAVLRHVRAGELGRIRLIRTSFCYYTGKTEGNIRFDPTLAGGALMDIGCYCISLMRLVADTEPNHVHCHGVLHESGVDHYAVGTMAFPHDIVADFACGMAMQTNNMALICGEQGYIEIPIPWKPPVTGATYTIRTMPAAKQDKLASPPEPRHETITLDADRPLYALEADDFAAAVLDGAEPAVSRFHSLGNQRVLDTMLNQVHG